MRGILRLILLITVVSSGGFFSELQSGLHAAESATAQNGDYDYRSLAISTILATAAEASRIPEIERRVTLLITAARLLPASSRDDAIRLLDICLRDLKEWVADDKKDLGRRYTAARLRGVVLSLYAKLDLKKATALQKDNRVTTDLSNDITESLRPGRKWSSEILARRGPADEAARTALAILEKHSDRAFALMLQSVEGGIVSNAVLDIFQRLEASGRRALLERMGAALGQTVASTSTLDPFSINNVSLLAHNPGITPASRRGIVRFLINSLERWSILVKAEDGRGGLDSSYISSSFMSFFLNARPVIVQYSSEDLLRVDVIFDQVSRLVPAMMKSMLRPTAPENLSDPKEQLAEILKEPSSENRDLQLNRYVSSLLVKSDGDHSENELNLASEAISHFNDSGLKTTYSDVLTIKRMNSLVKLTKFIEAQQLAKSLSSEETRAWAILALAAAAKADSILAFELTSSGLTALAAASPGPKKVELALMAAALLVRENPQRSFETLSVAAKYANSSPSAAPRQKNNIAGAIRLEAVIGDLSTLVARRPESLAEVRIDDNLAQLARSDWFRAQSTANDFREPSLRLSLKLQFAGSILGNYSK